MDARIQKIEAHFCVVLYQSYQEKMSSISESAIQMEARRRVSEEQAIARQAALNVQREREAEKLRLIEAQREDRIRRDAEQIQARLRAEEAEREVRRVAEKEAFEAAVQEQVKALKNRPLEESLRAEIEELREVVGTLTGQLSSSLQTPPPSYGISNLQKQVASLSACPWDTGIQELKAQLTELKTLTMRPARTITILASPTVLGQTNFPVAGQNITSGINSTTHIRTLEVVYHLVPQNSSTTTGQVLYIDIQEHHAGTISVPAGQKVSINSAKWKPHNNVRGGQAFMDVTQHLKALGVENQ